MFAYVCINLLCTIYKKTYIHEVYRRGGCKTHTYKRTRIGTHAYTQTRKAGVANTLCPEGCNLCYWEKLRHWARLALCFASGECALPFLARGFYFTQNHRVIITKIMCVELYYIQVQARVDVQKPFLFIYINIYKHT